jgi:hypothetical protein
MDDNRLLIIVPDFPALQQSFQGIVCNVSKLAKKLSEEEFHSCKIKY